MNYLISQKTLSFPRNNQWRNIIIICVVTLLAIFSFFYLYDNLVNTWESTLAKNIQQQKVVEVEPKTANDDAEMLRKASLMKSMDFSQISLPELPKRVTVKSTEISADKAFRKDIYKKGMTANRTQKNNVNLDNIDTSKPIQKKSSQAIGEQTAHVYNQLISDQSLSIEIAWPEQSNRREKLFNYLYQCVGMRFGVLNQQGVTLAKRSDQKNNSVYRRGQKVQHSEWLRIAQGSLGYNENKWLTQYQLSGTPIRLFPKQLDWQLARLVAEYLSGKIDNKGNPLKLTSLRAKYKLKGQRLVLVKISINNKSLNQQWLLVEMNCHL